MIKTDDISQKERLFCIRPSKKLAKSSILSRINTNRKGALDVMVMLWRRLLDGMEPVLSYACASDDLLRPWLKSIYIFAERTFVFTP